MIGELGEAVDYCRAGWAGWRFLLSPSYRQEIKEGWKTKKWYSMTWDIICGFSGVAFSLLIVWLVIYLICFS
jgi:hypothetical protein